MATSPSPPPSATGSLAALFNQFGIVPGQTSGSGPSLSGGSGSTPNLVFLGVQHDSHQVRSADFSGTVKSKQVNQQSVAQVLQLFNGASVEEQKQMAALLALAGYTQNGTVPLDQINEYVQSSNLPDILAGYQNLLNDAASRYANGSGQKVSPNELLQQAIQYRLHAAGIDWKGNLNSLWDPKAGGVNIPGAAQKGITQTVTHQAPKDGTTRTQAATQTTRDIMDPEDAKGLTRAMLQQELGRDPTQAEYEDFVATLQQAQRANPSTTTTTTNQKYDSTAGGWVDTSQNTTTHQGIGADGLSQLAQEKAQQNPDWAEWQAVGTYAPALFSALGATVSGVGG